MHLKFLITALLLIAGTQSAFAQLDPWEDYEISDALWNITMVKVHPNLGDDYLEGIAQTWAAANEVAKELGQIEDYHIFRSTLPESGDVNLFLVVKYANSDQLDPSREEYEKFMKAWGEEREERNREVSANYPSMREITGEYLVREITLK